MPRAGLDGAALLEAAAELVDELGMDALTLALVAQKLGIRSPSIYNHVQGLPELRRQLAIHGLRQLLVQMEQAASGREADEAIYALGTAYVSYAADHPGLYEATLRASDPQDLELQEAGEGIVQLTLSSLAYIGLTGEDAIHAVRALRSLLHGFASLRGQGAFGMPVRTEKSFEFAIGALLMGLHSQVQSAGDGL